MTDKTNHQLSGIRLYAIVLLRIVIGWHFLSEGISKLFTPSWSSADFICTGMYDSQIVEDINIACDILKSDINREKPWYA